MPKLSAGFSTAFQDMWCECGFIHFEKRKVEGLKELIAKGLIIK
jgi:hypothetical protein